MTDPRGASSWAFLIIENTTIMFIHRKHYLLLLLCTFLVLAGCSRSASPTSQPRSTLGQREVGDRFGRVPNGMNEMKSKRKKKKMKVAGTSNPYVEASRKKYHKMQKDMKKPQYSDPMYFGHKKKPKKRKRGKRKLCKECGIVH